MRRAQELSRIKRGEERKTPKGGVSRARCPPLRTCRSGIGGMCNGGGDCGRAVGGFGRFSLFCSCGQPTSNNQLTSPQLRRLNRIATGEQPAAVNYVAGVSYPLASRLENHTDCKKPLYVVGRGRWERERERQRERERARERGRERERERTTDCDLDRRPQLTRACSKIHDEPRPWMRLRVHGRAKNTQASQKRAERVSLTLLSFCPHSLPPPSLPPSLPPPSLPPSLTHSLTPSLPHSLPHSLTPSLPHFLTSSLPPSGHLICAHTRSLLHSSDPRSRL